MGSGARNKGMALFPRKIDGKYTMVARLDGENLFLTRSVQGKNVLGEILASRISAQTGARIHWLLDDEATGPPLDRLETF
jgi:hypothetical protein